MGFQHAIDFVGDANSAINTAVRLLGGIGFRVERQDRNSLAMIGPGMRATRQNPLLGATAIQFSFDHGHAALKAELGGVESMQRFLRRLPAILAAGFALLFGPILGAIFGQVFNVGFGVPFAPGWYWLAFVLPLTLLPILPWLVIAPLVGRATQRRTEQALVSLLATVTMVKSRQLA